MLRPHHSQDRRDAKREKREPRNNADIRPWISVGEAAQLALSKIIKNMDKPK